MIKYNGTTEYKIKMQKTSLVRGGFLLTFGESGPKVTGERKKVNQHTPVERAFNRQF